MTDKKIVIRDPVGTVINVAPNQKTIVRDDEITKVFVAEPNTVIIQGAGFVGNPGPQGIPGPAGSNKLFIQPTAPVTLETTYVWLQTHIGGNPADFTMWVEVGP